MKTRKATKALIAKPQRHADRQTIVLSSVAERHVEMKIWKTILRVEASLPQRLSSHRPLPSRATACSPTRCPSRSLASAHGARARKDDAGCPTRWLFAIRGGRLLHRNSQRVTLLRDVEHQKLQRGGLARVLVIVHGARREAAALSGLHGHRFLSDDLEQHRSLENVGEGVTGVVVLAHVRAGPKLSEEHARFLPFTRDEVSFVELLDLDMLHCVHKAHRAGADRDADGERHSEREDRSLHIQASCVVRVLAVERRTVWSVRGR